MLDRKEKKKKTIIKSMENVLLSLVFGVTLITDGFTVKRKRSSDTSVWDVS